MFTGVRLSSSAATGQLRRCHQRSVPCIARPDLKGQFTRPRANRKRACIPVRAATETETETTDASKKEKMLAEMKKVEY